MKNRYEIRGDVTAIFVQSKKHGEHEFLIDTKYLKEVSEAAGTWNFHLTGECKYARCKTKESNYKKWLHLHRLITKAPSDKVVDHINHNTLDNRISNLRLLTNAENSQNRSGAARNNRTSRIRGVSWHKGAGKWIVQVKAKGVKYYIGSYSDIEEAKHAAIEARKRLLPYSFEKEA